MKSRRQHGFSLLEVLVAFVIMGLSLGVLYQSVTGSIRNVAVTERYAYAEQMARSLLATRDKLPPSGLSDSGRGEDGFRWQMETLHLPDTRPEGSGWRDDFMLLEARVEWGGSRSRQVILQTVLPVEEGA